MHIQEIARRLGAEVAADADLEITGVATVEDAGPSDLTFLSNPRYVRPLRDSRAAAVFVAPDFGEDVPPVCLRVRDPYLAFARAISLFHRSPRPAAGVHPTAVLGRDVGLGEDVAVGPYVVLGDGVRVGDGTVIHPHVAVYEGAEIGPGCVLHSHCVVREHVRLGGGVVVQNGAVVGADGFGFAKREDGSWEKIPQVGTVEVAEDVEIQANACVDRAAVGRTTVGRGTKIDNLVQVGHGCRIGEDSLLCGQVGLAGTTTIGDRVTLAGQAGIAGHCTVGDDVTVGAQSGVHSSLKGPAVFIGTPVVDGARYRRVVYQWARLPELAKRVKALERQVQGGKP